jgi:NADH:ubiquinone oxidoreductase subunit 5 (subunit L)/multisubunit Na+/H+ antiporter MnhA subunit
VGGRHLTSLLTATYMFRLVHLTFHGEERFGAAVRAAAQAHGHDAARGTRAPAHGTCTGTRTARTGTHAATALPPA